MQHCYLVSFHEILRGKNVACTFQGARLSDAWKEKLSSNAYVQKVIFFQTLLMMVITPNKKQPLSCFFYKGIKNIYYPTRQHVGPVSMDMSRY